MTTAKPDPCVLLKRNRDVLQGMVALQVDTHWIFYAGFLQAEEQTSRKFKIKSRGFLEDKELVFNGLDLNQTETGIIRMAQ